MLKAQFSREAIKVFSPNEKEPFYLWDIIIDHCAKRFSPNELRKILKDCEIQIKKLGPENTPENFNEMVRDLRNAMMDMGISFEPPVPSITIVLPFYRQLKRLADELKQVFSKFFSKLKMAL